MHSVSICCIVVYKINCSPIFQHTIESKSNRMAFTMACNGNAQLASFFLLSVSIFNSSFPFLCHCSSQFHLKDAKQTVYNKIFIFQQQQHSTVYISIKNSYGFSHLSTLSIGFIVQCTLHWSMPFTCAICVTLICVSTHHIKILEISKSQQPLEVYHFPFDSLDFLFYIFRLIFSLSPRIY